MKEQEIMCPNCGAILKVTILDHSMVVGTQGKDKKAHFWLGEKYDDAIKIPSYSHQKKHPQGNKRVCDEWLIYYVKHNFADFDNNQDLSVEI